MCHASTAGRSPQPAPGCLAGGAGLDESLSCAVQGPAPQTPGPGHAAGWQPETPGIKPGGRMSVKARSRDLALFRVLLIE